MTTDMTTVNVYNPRLGTVEIDGMTFAVKTICEVPIPTPVEIDKTIRNVDSEGYEILCQICDEYAGWHWIPDISYWVCDQCRIDIHKFRI